MKSGVKYLLIAFVLASMASCVGNRQVVVFQDTNDGNNYSDYTDQTVPDSFSSYILKPGDVVYIRFEKFKIGQELLSVSSIEQQQRSFQVSHPYLTGSTINDSGIVNHSVLGKLQAGGKTISEFRNELAAEANSLFPGSVAELFLLNGTVTIIGDVARGGRYPIFKESNTVVDAIALAGDFQQYADRKTVKIIRKDGNQTRVIHLDLTKIETLSSPYFYVQNDDVIVVSPLARKKYVTANVQWLVSSVTALVAVASLVITVTR